MLVSLKGIQYLSCIILYLDFRVAQMEDAQEIQDESSEAILDDASEDKQESRDEMLSRHRYLFSFCSLVLLVLLLS